MVTMMNGWLKGLVPHRAGMTDGLFIVDIYIISDIYEKNQIFMKKSCI